MKYLHVLADELYDALLHHGVGHVDGEQDARRLRGHGISVQVFHLFRTCRLKLSRISGSADNPAG